MITMTGRAASTRSICSRPRPTAQASRSNVNCSRLTRYGGRHRMFRGRFGPRPALDRRFIVACLGLPKPLETSGRGCLFLRTFARTYEGDGSHGKERKTREGGKASRLEKVDARHQNLVKRLSREVHMTDGHPLRHDDARSPGNSRRVTA